MNLETVSPSDILKIFLLLRVVQHGIEAWLSNTNFKWWSQESHLNRAKEVLGITDEDMSKTIAYSKDKYLFSRVRSLIEIVVTIVFLGSGGIGWCERTASEWALQLGGGELKTGLVFFGLLIVLTQIFSLPFALFNTFVIEQRHGFNKQTLGSYFQDLGKGLILGVLLGAPLLLAILWIMQNLGSYWWVFAWATMTIFSLFAAWIYPTLLAPIFNKFTPLEDGVLKEQIEGLARKVGFGTDGIFKMDASKRTGHGNAYFTGVFGKKRIVLFDTLLQSLSPSEIVAVLAHELGHFKLHHVRWSLVRGIFFSFVTFAAIGALLPYQNFYEAFGLSSPSNHAALVIFSLLFGLIEFYLQPLHTWISRKNEFAADRFAVEKVGGGEVLADALKKLREKSHAMPIAHPLFSGMYYSHPPMLERIDKLLSR